MKKFMVYCSEIVYYAIEVEAETEKEAWQFIEDGMYEGKWEPDDGDHFQIDEVVELTDD